MNTYFETEEFKKNVELEDWVLRKGNMINKVSFYVFNDNQEKASWTREQIEKTYGNKFNEVFETESFESVEMLQNSLKQDGYFFALNRNLSAIVFMKDAEIISRFFMNIKFRDPHKVLRFE